MDKNHIKNFSKFVFLLFIAMNAYVFPGQGSQFSGMGKDLYDNYPIAKELFEKANSILGFDIAAIMFTGSDDDLKQTRITQPAIFLHSVIKAFSLGDAFRPDMAAGHSLGELSAIVAVKAISFEEGLSLVYKRALAMQEACNTNPSAMAAILGLEDQIVEQVCDSIPDTVVTANYNCPGQIVISGTNEGIDKAVSELTAKGAKRALKLPVNGAFHSPLMNPAKEELQKAINETSFIQPICPVYQNVTALPSSNPETIKKNLIEQLTSPVRWTQTIKKMTEDGAKIFYEVGPGKVLQGLIKKIAPDAQTESA